MNPKSIPLNREPLDKVDRRLAQGRKAGALLEKLGCEVGSALAQRASHVDAFSAAAWIGAHAQGTPAHDDIRILTREVEDQLARCPAPEPFVAAALRADAARAGNGLAPGIAAGLLELVGLLRPRLRRPDFASLLRLRPSASLRQP